MQETRVRVWEDPTCHRASKPVHRQLLSLCSRARGPQLLSARAAAAGAHGLRACALQQDKPVR